ncbi:MAG: hypothetical protein QOE13_1913 [Gaiellaceae bacterium]|nr:hypothetical protein [Gaiellaceae bacterium]
MGKEGSRHVTAPFRFGQPSLSRRAPRPRQERAERKIPESCKLGRQPFRGMVSALQSPVRIARHEDNTFGVRTRKGVVDDCRGPPRQAAQASFLPRGHDPAQPVVVRDCRPRTRESEPPAGALGTALDRPCSGCPATLAEWRPDATQRRRARLADLGAGNQAHEATLR